MYWDMHSFISLHKENLAMKKKCHTKGVTFLSFFSVFFFFFFFFFLLYLNHIFCFIQGISLTFGSYLTRDMM